MKLIDILIQVHEYYRIKPSKMALDIYMQALSKFEPSEVKQILMTHIADPDQGQYMPKVSDVVRILNGTKRGQASTAWSKVDKAIRAVGPWQSVCFDDPIINKSLDDLGGWIAVCECNTEKDLEFKRNEFQRLYESYKSQGGVSEHPNKLTGIIESSKDSLASDPILIGDDKRAKHVYLNGSNQNQIKLTSLPTGLTKMKLINKTGMSGDKHEHESAKI